MHLLITMLLLQLRGQTEAAQCACATDVLHVHSDAGKSNPIVHLLQPGQCVTYLGHSKEASGYTWLDVRVDRLGGQSLTGWAVSDWLHVGDCDTNLVQLPGCPKIITRAEWGARAPRYSIGKMPATPVYVFIHHSGGPQCLDRSSCTAIVRRAQTYHADTHGWSVIGYSFLVGEDGNAYEARGWTEIGAHALGYNNNSIAICVIGNFNKKLPNAAALSTVRQLIQCGLANGKISAYYTLKGHRDVRVTLCPGTALYNLIHSWPHYGAGGARYG